jgi:hypothetical protein
MKFIASFLYSYLRAVIECLSQYFVSICHAIYKVNQNIINIHYNLYLLFEDDTIFNNGSVILSNLSRQEKQKKDSNLETNIDTAFAFI